MNNSKDPKMVEIVFDLKAVANVAHTGIRRTSVFLGLGIHASMNKDMNDYELTKIQRYATNNTLQVNFVPPNASQTDIDHYKEEFSIWITACGLRQLVETFAVFLDVIHWNCILAASNGKSINNGDLIKKTKKFKAVSNVAEKLETLKKEFSIQVEEDLVAYWRSICQARNCFAHRNGIVDKELDCGNEETMSVKWLGGSVFIAFEDGTEVPFNEMIGVQLKTEGEIILKLIERERKFSHNTVIKFSPDDVGEICWFVSASVAKVMSSFSDLLKRNGISH